MKNRIYILLFLILMSFVFNAKATNHTVVVSGNYPNLTFTPSNLVINVGDSITWMQDFVTYPLTSVSVPDGATPFNYRGYGSSYSYQVLMPGVYTYNTPNYQFAGEFTAQAATGIQQYPIKVTTANIYPTITSDVVNVNVKEVFNTSRTLSLQVFNILGNQVYNVDFLSSDPTLIHLGDMPNGIYFVSIRENNNVMAVQKVVKD